VIVLIFTIGISFTSLSKSVLFKLWHTEFMATRLFTCILQGILLMIAFNDFRAIFVPGLILLQLLAFSTDALVIPKLRAILVSIALISSIVTFILIVFGLSGGPLTNITLPIGENQYSLLQSARDILIVQVMLFIIEIVHVIRGRDLKRFLHITSPVTFRIIPLEESKQRERKRQGRYEADASSIVPQSGFFMHQVSMVQQDDTTTANQVARQDNGGNNNKTRVYVNKIAIRCSDSIGVRYFGEGFYQKLSSPVGIGLFYLCLLVAIIPSAFIIVNGEVALALIPLMFILAIREFLTSSLTLLKLLIKRIAFMGASLFGLVWLGITSYALGGDSRICVAFYGFIAYVTILLQDANTVKGSSGNTILVMVDQFLLIQKIVPIMILSIYLLLDILPGTEHAVITVYSTVIVSSNSSSLVNSINDVQSVDLAQQAGDLGFFSLFLPILLKGMSIGWKKLYSSSNKEDNVLMSIASPVMPIFDDNFEDENNNDGNLDNLSEIIEISREELKTVVNDLVLRMVVIPEQQQQVVIDDQHQNNNNNNNVGSVVVNTNGSDDSNKEMTEIIFDDS
jgi:hypothetical protein